MKTQILNLVFSSFKFNNFLNVKNSVPTSLHSVVVYTFHFVGRNFNHVGEISGHLSTPVHKHLNVDERFCIFKYLRSSDKCEEYCNNSCPTVLDTALIVNVRLKRLCIFYERSLF